MRYLEVEILVHVRVEIERHLTDLRGDQDEGAGVVAEPFDDLLVAVSSIFAAEAAVVAENRLVVIELKVSRGYDSVVGQLLRYMEWIKGTTPSHGKTCVE
jgi:hypothetical protein